MFTNYYKKDLTGSQKSGVIHVPSRDSKKAGRNGRYKPAPGVYNNVPLACISYTSIGIYTCTHICNRLFYTNVMHIHVNGSEQYKRHVLRTPQ